MVLDGVNSATQEVSSGVQQGSILGLLLFALCEHSLSNPNLKHFVLKMYADDIVVYKSVLCEDNLVEMQSDVT